MLLSLQCLDIVSGGLLMFIYLPEMHSIYVQGRPTPETLRNIPLPAPVAPPMLFYQPLDSRALLLKQIEYYFR